MLGYQNKNSCALLTFISDQYQLEEKGDVFETSILPAYFLIMNLFGN
jgi:hypothetical protein